MEIRFEVGRRENVRLSVYRLDGRRIALLLDEVRSPGPASVIWDGRDRRGREAPSGLYLVRMEAGAVTQSQKLVLLR